MTTGTGYDEFMEVDALSQVIFVHDYVQLVFHPLTLTVLPALVLRLKDGKELKAGSFGFCDRLVGHIGQRVVDTSSVPKTEMCFHLSNGTTLVVSLRPEDGVGPEVMHVSDPSGIVSVDRYEDFAPNP